MKKIIVLVCAGALALSVFAGCTPQPSPSPAPSAEATPEVSAEVTPEASAEATPEVSAESSPSTLPETDSDGEGVVNPMKDYENMEDLIKFTGIEMGLPSDVEDVEIFSIDTNMNQVNFKLKDGSEYTYRKAKADFPDLNGKDDISGYYVEWKDVHEAKSPKGTAVTVKTGNGANSEQGIAIWNDGTHKFCIAVEKGVEGKFDETMLLTLVDGVK